MRCRIRRRRARQQWFDDNGAAGIGAAMFMALLVPAYSIMILRGRAQPFDAAAIAATQGSISAVTFFAAQQFLTHNDVGRL